MKKEIKSSITISDVYDGELIGFQLEDLIKKTDFYDKNDVDNILDYRLDWRKTDALVLKVYPDATNTVQFMLPKNSINFRMRIFWDMDEITTADNTSLFVSEPYENDKTIEFTYSSQSVKYIAILGEIGTYCTKGTILDILQFGETTVLKSLGNMLSHLDASNKNMQNVTALDGFKSSKLEVIDSYTFLGIPLDKLPSDLETWDVTNVTSLKNFLSGRTDFNKNLSAWKTPHLNNITGIFNQLTTIPFNIDNWDFSNVLIGDSVFKGLNLSNVDLSKLKFTQMLTADYMYQNTIGISKFNLQAANNTSSITTAIGLFKDATLNNQIINNDFRELVYANSMFENALLNNCNINLTLPKCIDVSSMFKNATLINTTINLTFTCLEAFVSGFDNAIIDASSRINIDFGLKGKVNCNYIFYKSNIKYDNLDNIINTSNILYADYMFADTTENVNINKFTLDKVISANGFIQNNSNFNSSVYNLKLTNCLYLDSAFMNCSLFDGTGLDGLLCTNLSDIDNIFKNCSSLTNSNVIKVLSKTIKTMNYSFYGVPASMTGSIILPIVETMDYAFYNCSNMNIDFNLCSFDSATSMISAFENCSLFNQPLSLFNPVNLLSNGLDRTFANCSSFNQNIPTLNLLHIASIDSTFTNCISFNEPLNISAPMCTKFKRFLSGCSTFNSSITTYLPECYDVTETLSNCVVFNQSVSNFSFGKNAIIPISIERLFYNCSSFNQDLSSFPASKITNISYMLYNCQIFNQDIGSLLFTKLVNMNRAFWKCKAISDANWTNAKNWIMNYVTDMTQTFYYCTYFNVQVSLWVTPLLTTLEGTFALCTTFNQSLYNWNLSNVINLLNTFLNCSALKNQLFNSTQWNQAATRSNSVLQYSNTFSGTGTGNTLPVLL